MPTIAFRLAALAMMICACLHSAGATAADAATARPRAALVIGNASYSAVTTLKNPAYDAHDMCDALTELGYTAACFTDVKDAREFKARIQDFAASLQPKSEVVFYYAGHAVQVRGENYLVPTGARLRAQTDIARETVSLKFIMTQLLQAKHYVNIVILDACRSNPWPDNPGGMAAGLAPITAIPRGTMVMYATAANDVSDDGEGHNGTLTKNLLANIKTPGLTADEFFKHVSEGVQSDSAAAVGHTQIPALYTNFTGEFCFAGCIDKVARAELEKLQKANTEQLQKLQQANEELLEQSRREKAEVDAKLAASMTSMSCDKAVVSDTSQCFDSSRIKTLRAVTAALQQKGFTIRDDLLSSAADVVGTRSSDNPQNKSLTDLLVVSASVREIPVTLHSIVTLTAEQQTVLHDESHTWTQVFIIPIPTSKQYKDVVKRDINITDPQFYLDLFTAVERNIHSDAGPESAGRPDSRSDSRPDSFWAPTPKSATSSTLAAPVSDPEASAEAASLPKITRIMQPGGHEQTYQAPFDKSVSALIGALVAQGFVIDSASSADGLINAARWTKDLKDANSSTRTQLAAEVTENATAGGCIVQIDATDSRVLHEEGHNWGHKSTAIPLVSILPMPTSKKYQDVVKSTGAMSETGYRELFGLIDATLGGTANLPQDRTRHFATPVAQTWRAAIDALAQSGFDTLHPDEQLHMISASRRLTQKIKNEGETSQSVDATIYVVADPSGNASAGSMLLVSADTRDFWRPLNNLGGLSGKQMQDIIDQMPEQEYEAARTVYYGSDGVTHEGAAEPALYQELLTSIGRKVNQSR